MTHLTRIQDHGDIFLFNKISCVTIGNGAKTLSVYLKNTSQHSKSRFDEIIFCRSKSQAASKNTGIKTE